MCKPNSQLHFCTCTSLKKKPLHVASNSEVNKAEYEKTHYIWTL